MICTESTVLSLESILKDPASDLFKDFANYLNTSYCIENLAFWIATQEYYKEFNNREKLCESMINLYIRPNSLQEINIPCDMRQSILDFYNQGNCHLHIFDDAAEAVLELMRVNSFLPWITTTPTWSFDTLMSTSSFSSSSSSTSKQYKSWSSSSPPPPPPINNSPSITSLVGLSSSFLFTDKWNLKLKQQLSRKSCSLLDIQDHDRFALVATEFSVSSATTPGTRYKSMLKRVKKSLLGNNDGLLTPRPSFTADNASSSWSYWRKSQR